MKHLEKFTTLIVGAQLLICSCSGPALKEENEKIPFVGTLSVSRHVFHNGLRVLILKDTSSPTFAIQTWYDVGSKDEKVGYTGLAHLFEHLMFKETKTLKPGEFDRLLERAGAEGTNAFTSKDYTAYVQELPKDKLDLVLRLEADRMQNLIVDTKAFETEREVVQNERRFRNENNPSGMMYQTLYETAYGTHPYRWPTIGYQEDLERMTAVDALDFYKKFYSPDRAVIVIVGDVGERETLNLVDKYFGHLKPSGTTKDPLPQEPPQKGAKKKRLKLNIEVEELDMGYRIPGVQSKDLPVFEVLQAILSDGKSSRLTRALVETGVATHVSSGAYHALEPSIFTVSSGMQKGRQAASAESVILAEFARLSKDLVGEKELERAKNIVRFNFYNPLGSHTRKANFLGSYEIIAGSFEKGLEIYKNVPNVTAEDVKRVVNDYFSPDNRTTIIGVPK